MNLKEFLDGIDLDASRAGPAAQVSINTGGVDKRVHTQYIQLLVAVRHNPGMCFHDVAMVADGVDDARKSVILDRPAPVFRVMHTFKGWGALDIKDYHGKEFPLEPLNYHAYASGARYFLNDTGLENMTVQNVLALHPADQKRVEELYPVD